MSVSFVKKCTLACVLLLGYQTMHALSSKSKNDYFPLYTTLQPHEFLHTQVKEIIHGRTDETDKRNRLGISLSPFGQSADMGRDINNDTRNLGSLPDRWGMIGLLLGNLPIKQTLPVTLTSARNTLLPGAQVGFDDETVMDESQEFGFFSMPATYRRRGLRAKFSVGIFEDLGISVEVGASDINFTVTTFQSLSVSPHKCLDSAQYPQLTQGNVDKNLMCKIQEISNDIGLNLCDFHKTSIEDVRLHLFWRRAFEINKDKNTWENFLLIPYFDLGATFGSGREVEGYEAFGQPFGNNGHHSIGLDAGINIDFFETIEIGGEVGITHFFQKDFNDMFIPTSEHQRGIFPFKTNVTIDPGFNWHFALKLNAHHFLERLSFYFQWAIIEHQADKIHLRGDCDPAFKPKALECASPWKAQVINTALNYDISPHVGLGFAWQAPVSQRNVFKSTTVMFGINFVF